MEKRQLRVRCGDSDRAVPGPSVSGDIREPGPVWVIESRRTQVSEWFAMWYFPTKAVAEAQLERAIGFEGNGGVVTDARVTEGVAYWSEGGTGRTRRQSRRPLQAYTSVEEMGY